MILKQVAYIIFPRRRVFLRPQPFLEFLNQKKIKQTDVEVF